MKKIRKSKQAILITFLVGLIVPKITIITGHWLVDSALFKIILASCFYISTLTVGLLYSFKWLKGRKAGGIARIIIYFLLLIPILCLITPIGNLLLTIGMYLMIAVVGVAIIIGIIALILHIKDAVEIRKSVVYYKRRATKKTKKQKVSDTSNQPDVQPSVVQECKSESTPKPQVKQIPRVKTENITKVKANNAENVAIKPEKVIEKALETTERKKTDNEIFNEIYEMFGNLPKSPKVEKSKYTIDELWADKDSSQDYITVTNDENPNLKDIRIYNSRRSDGKFYGYVLMNDARRTVYGEIYYSNKKIWYMV